MTRIDIDAGTLRVVIEGFDRILALKGTIDIPLAHVSGVALHPEGASHLHALLRAPGTSIPGVVTAGSYYLADRSWLFVDVHDSTKTIRIDLDHEHYAALIVDVADPSATVGEIERALLGRT
ncbi:MAG TPA: hypothetical protein VF344_00535 [Candidatus Limnocylindrales bacterium]